MTKRRISAKAILKDLRSGIRDPELMERHDLTEDELRTIYKKMVRKKLLPENKLAWREVFWDDNTTLDITTLEMDLSGLTDE